MWSSAPTKIYSDFSENIGIISAEGIDILKKK